MPWTWVHVRTEVLTAENKWVQFSHEQASDARRAARKAGLPKEKYWHIREEDFPDHRQIHIADYAYPLKSGEIQKRKATFFVEEMEWRLRMFYGLKIGPKRV